MTTRLTSHAAGRLRNAAREVAPLVTAYLELVLGHLDPKVRVQVAVDAALGLDHARLRALAVAVSDAHPWQPFLRTLVAVPGAERTPALTHAFGRLYDLAVAMLRDQGCGVVCPEDLLLRASPLERAAQAALGPPTLNTTPLQPW